MWAYRYVTSISKQHVYVSKYEYVCSKYVYVSMYMWKRMCLLGAARMCKLEQVSVGFEQVSVGLEQVSEGLEQVSVGLEQVSVGLEQVSAGRNAPTMALISVGLLCWRVTA
jgi:hypothetical protein